MTKRAIARRGCQGTSSLTSSHFKGLLGTEDLLSSILKIGLGQIGMVVCVSRRHFHKKTAPPPGAPLSAFVQGMLSGCTVTGYIPPGAYYPSGTLPPEALGTQSVKSRTAFAPLPPSKASTRVLRLSATRCFRHDLLETDLALFVTSAGYPGYPPPSYQPPGYPPHFAQISGCGGRGRGEVPEKFLTVKMTRDKSRSVEISAF